MAAGNPVAIDDGDTIATSFPGFTALMNGLGAAITTADDARADDARAADTGADDAG
jgi:3-phosphoshikimate 1-carboxyvinyltransferase